VSLASGFRERVGSRAACARAVIILGLELRNRGSSGRKRKGDAAGSSVKKNEDFLDFSVDLTWITGFMLNQRKNDRSSSP
jgi:hypothetical protein